jgi:SAM-dependent methyltransferase
MGATQENRSDYWQSYYSKEQIVKRTPPSQFAAFVAQEISDLDVVVDVGCGNGRDGIFFADYGFEVVGVDGSQAAVEFAGRKAAARGLINMRFVQSDIKGDTLAEVLEGFGEKNICIYARFFLHAITQDEQDHFVALIADRTKPGDKVAFEFRTPEDEALEKVADAHYRRFVNPDELSVAMKAKGFDTDYIIVGKGFAKYKSEDAHVARTMFTKQAV